jgi:hypothetical protein
MKSKVKEYIISNSESLEYQMKQIYRLDGTKLIFFSKDSLIVSLDEESLKKK